MLGGYSPLFVLAGYANIPYIRRQLETSIMYITMTTHSNHSKTCLVAAKIIKVV